MRPNFGNTMAADSVKTCPRVEVCKANAQEQPVIANMLELYIHDFSEFFELELGEDGRFGYPSLSLYWCEPGRRPFLIRSDGKLAGFALVKRGSEFSGNCEVWDVAEFFVLRGYRDRGIGATAAQQLWTMLPGLWEVRVLQSNTGARRFWSRTIEGFIQKPIDPLAIEKDGRGWDLFSFEAQHQDTGNRP